jgi:hypothetical protein
MSTHHITAEIEYRFRIPGMPDDEHETAYPEIEITFEYRKGTPAVMYQRNGDPGWPAEPAEVEIISTKLIKSDGVALSPDQIEQMAEDWLNGSGYDRAIEQVELDTPDRDY